MRMLEYILYKKNLMLLYSAVLLSNFIFGQTTIALDSLGRTYSFSSFPEGIIKEELSGFVLVNRNTRSNDFSPHNGLKRIGFITERRCSMNFSDYGTGVYLSTEAIDTTFHNDMMKKYGFEINSSNERISRLLYRYRRYHVFLPDSAFQDLYGFDLCSMPPKKKRTSQSAVYSSSNNLRTYVHLILGREKPYEVTFILESWRYVGRVIDEH